MNEQNIWSELSNPQHQSMGLKILFQSFDLTVLTDQKLSELVNKVKMRIVLVHQSKNKENY